MTPKMSTRTSIWMLNRWNMQRDKTLLQANEEAAQLWRPFYGNQNLCQLGREGNLTLDARFLLIVFLAGTMVACAETPGSGRFQAVPTQQATLLPMYAGPEAGNMDRL